MRSTLGRASLERCSHFSVAAQSIRQPYLPRRAAFRLKQDMQLRFSAMTRKFDINVESLREEIQTVAGSVTALADEMRRATEAIRKDRTADREVLRRSLLNHADRLHVLERDDH